MARKFSRSQPVKSLLKPAYLKRQYGYLEKSVR